MNYENPDKFKENLKDFLSLISKRAIEKYKSSSDYIILKNSCRINKILGICFRDENYDVLIGGESMMEDQPDISITLSYEDLMMKEDDWQYYLKHFHLNDMRSLILWLWQKGKQINKDPFICSMCNNLIDDFRNKKSMDEYKISGMCQQCQDKTFGED
jgi:uncharacterized CHY-type Zn-finger protein